MYAAALDIERNISWHPLGSSRVLSMNTTEHVTHLTHTGRATCPGPALATATKDRSMFLSNRSRFHPMLAALALFCLGAAPPSQTAPASQQADSSRALSLSRKTMSPFCPGRTLVSCSSSQASDWVSDIRTWVRDGLSDQDIIAALGARVDEMKRRGLLDQSFDLSGEPSTLWKWILSLLSFGGVSAVLSR